MLIVDGYYEWILLLWLVYLSMFIIEVQKSTQPQNNKYYNR